MTDLSRARLDAIPELKTAIAELEAERNQKIEELIREPHDLATYISLAAEVRTLNRVVQAPYKPRQRNPNAA